MVIEMLSANDLSTVSDFGAVDFNESQCTGNRYTVDIYTDEGVIELDVEKLGDDYFVFSIDNVYVDFECLPSKFQQFITEGV